MNLAKLKINNMLSKIKIFLNKNFISAILNILISLVFAKYFIGYEDNFISFFSSEYGIWFNVILTHILINNVQTPYFQPPKDIFLNSLTLITIMVPIISYTEKFNLNYAFSKIYFYYILIFTSICILLYSLYITIKFFNEKIKTENLIYRICTAIIIKYNLLFLFGLLISASIYDKISDIYLIIICYLIIYSKIIDNIVDTIYEKFIKNNFKINIKNYGELYRIDEPNIYRIISKENIEKNKLLLLQQENEIVRLLILKNENTKDGIIYTCIKIGVDENKNKQVKNNIVFDTEEMNEDIFKQYENIIGFVVENSNINSIKFELISSDNSLKVGDVIYFLNKNEKKVFYQIVNGATHEELLNNNFIGNQIVEAMQLGILDENKKLVEYPWFPSMNEKIYKYKCEEDDFTSKDSTNFYIGNCHGLNLPIEIDIDKLITYHSAILGVTGTGKSTLAFKIIEEVSKNHKVVCIDITGEYKIKFKEQSTIISNTNNLNDNGIYIYEINEILNDKIIDNVKNFINTLFENQKKMKENKILLVLEESHTIAPEDFFISRNSFDLKASIQAISQIALQGRKYGIGLLLISQRTALVSKTILSQCNTFFTFSLMDQTSLDFLKNFYGEAQIKIIPNLEKYHLIAHGVAIESEKPVIINTTDNNLDDDKMSKTKKVEDDDIPF